MAAIPQSALRNASVMDIRWPIFIALLIAVLHPLVLTCENIRWHIVAILGFGIITTIVAITQWRTTNLSGWIPYEKAFFGLAWAMVGARILTSFGLDGYPLIYLAVALIVAVYPGKPGWFVVAGALVLELVAQWQGAIILAETVNESTAWDNRWIVFGGRACFIVAFASLSHIVHGREVLQQRREKQLLRHQEQENIQREAREFRLIHSGRNGVSETTRERAEELITRDAIDAIHHVIFLSLELVKNALTAHTAILLWYDTRKEHLHIKELVSDSDAIVDHEIDPAKGVLGGITRRREALRLDGIRPGFRGLSYYYNSMPDVTAFLGVPVLEKGHLRGILCVDRISGTSFSEQDEQLIHNVGQYIMRAVENERIFSNIEKTRYELSRFYEASRQLNTVLTPEDVYRVALQCVRQIVDYDFAAITVYNEESCTHTIALVNGKEDLFSTIISQWQGRVFGDNSGLVSMVIKNRHYLPVGGHKRDNDPVIFTRDERFESINSLIVLPLLVQESVLGTLVIADRQANLFTTRRREMLEVITHQVAITLQNARLYARMEEMAMLDGLTQLANRRTFQQRLDEAMARQKRTGRPLSLVIMDVDHFKSVNDTYGHSVGDEVLKKVAQALKFDLREVDLAARYGGEEFILLMEETGGDDAFRVADRLREKIGQLIFHTDKGSLSCTISMGIATCPGDAQQGQALIEAADKALYFSKENGRNQVTNFQHIKY